MGSRLQIIVLALLLCPCLVLAQGETAPARLEVSVEPLSGSVGDLLATTIVLEAPADAAPELPEIGSELGPFTVSDGSWSDPEPAGELTRWTWNGHVAVYRTGTHELPALSVRLDGGGDGNVLTSKAVSVEIGSVVAEAAGEEGGADIADLKPPASVPGKYGSLLVGLALLAVLLLGSGLLWWLQRRYAGRLAAARVPLDPFHRMPPHVWVYKELQRLLDLRLEDRGEVERFHSELARIVKFYLGGRYRVDLMESTSSEVPPLLRQAGAPPEAVGETETLLVHCDGVKFARERPPADRWRELVELAYRVVDRTKPVDSDGEEADRGAA